MSCPRCEAERRSARAFQGMLVGFGVTLALCAASVVVGPWALPVALTVTAADAVLGTAAVRLARRAEVPQPTPAADPLATYREGLAVECPRHPFAG